MLEYRANENGNSAKKLPLSAACKNKHEPVVQLLLTNGADSNLQEEPHGYFNRCSLPLHISASDGNSELVELLLKHDANVDLADTDGNTALYRAVEHYHPILQYSEKGTTKSIGKTAVDILLENKADVNKENNSGETPLYRAASRQLRDVVTKMLDEYGGDPNKGSPLMVACRRSNVDTVDTLLKHGADPNLASASCDRDSKHRLPLFAAVDEGNSDVVKSLLNAGANVNAVNDEGKTVVCFAAETLTGSYYCSAEMKNKLSTVHLLIQHGANLNMPMPDGRSPLHLAVAAVSRGYGAGVAELLQLMVAHGAMLQDSSSLPRDVGRQSPASGTLKALATFDGSHEFIVDLFRAGAGFQLVATCCNAVAPVAPREAKSIGLCQAAILAGYTPIEEELHHLQVEAARDNVAGHLIQQLVNWLNEDRQQVPSLLRRCRVVIRRQLSVAVHFQSILPAIDKLPLPTDLKLYLQFDGRMTEVDLSLISKEVQTLETSLESRRQSLSSISDNDEYNHYDNYDSDDYYGYDAYDSDYYWLHFFSK